jgi:hypothetical protein
MLPAWMWPYALSVHEYPQQLFVHGGGGGGGADGGPDEDDGAVLKRRRAEAQAAKRLARARGRAAQQAIEVCPCRCTWPVPNLQASTYQIVLWRQRYIMDVGTMTQEVEIPQRWYEAIVALLATRLALEVLEVDPQLVPTLNALADKALMIAQMEERDNSPMMIQPNIGPYTR